MDSRLMLFAQIQQAVCVSAKILNCGFSVGEGLC